jgi:hypothetical protein
MFGYLQGSRTIMGLLNCLNHVAGYVARRKLGSQANFRVVHIDILHSGQLSPTLNIVPVYSITEAILRPRHNPDVTDSGVGDIRAASR